METREIKIRLDLPLMSKARPRFGKGRSYLPASYRQWKQQARQLLRMFWEAHGLETLDQFELHSEPDPPDKGVHHGRKGACGPLFHAQQAVPGSLNH